MKEYTSPPSMMVISLIGFLISIVYTSQGVFSSIFPESWNTGGTDFGLSLGVAFCTLFIMMFIAAFVNMAPTDEELRSLK